MIQRSTIVALTTIFLSLLLHAIGLSFSSDVRRNQISNDDVKDVVTISNSFEEIAENLDVSNPPEPDLNPDATPEKEIFPKPELITAPEPEEQSVPEPETAEKPTSEVLVASSNPKKTPVPDTGAVQSAGEGMAGAIGQNTITVPKPEIGRSVSQGEEQVLEPVTNKGDIVSFVELPDVTAKAVEAFAISPISEPIATSPAKQLTSLPTKILPVLPVSPIELEMLSSSTPDIALKAITDVLENIEMAIVTPLAIEDEITFDSEILENGGIQNSIKNSNQTMISSLRPRLPLQRRSKELENSLNGTTSQTALPQRSQLIESPLAAYRRDGTDLTLLNNSNSQSGGSGGRNFQGTGNSDVTNYAGRVFMHLNRAPPIRVAGRGYVRVFFEINPDGSVARIDIIESSGSKDIERAAKEQIRVAEPLPLPPNGNVRRMSLYYRSN
jgi:TonB family protein